MNPDLKKDLLAYAHELAHCGPVVNSSHITLRRLWDTYGRDVVDQGIATLPEFKTPCRRPYSIENPKPVPGVREDRRTGQFVPTINGVDTSPTSFNRDSAVQTACASVNVGPSLHWPAIVGKLLALLQASGFTLERVDDGEVTLLASGTPRQRRQQIKQVVVNSNCSHLTVSVDGKFLWLYIDLSRKPFECVTDCSDSLALEKTIQIFHQYYKNN